MANQASVLINQSNNAGNRVEIASAPAGGVLVGGWFKQIAATGMLLKLSGTNWELTLVQQSPSQLDVRLACTSQSHTVYVNGSPGPAALGFSDSRWFWACLHAYVAADSSLLVGFHAYNGSAWVTGGPWTTTRTLATIKTNGTNHGWTAGEASAFVPSAVAKISIGEQITHVDQTDYAPTAFSATHARVRAVNAIPSTTVLGALVGLDAADSGDWAYWPITWLNSAAVLTDGTGNSRDLTSVGTLAQGADSNFTLVESVAAPPNGFFLSLVDQQEDL